MTSQAIDKMSIEDKRFMKIANESIVLKNGHYQLDLPFRKENTNAK